MSSQADDQHFARVLEEFTENLRNGRAPTVEAYANRHPDFAERIHSLFPSVLALEKMNAQQSLSIAQPTPFSDAGTDRIGDYRVLYEIGRGGMGVVYAAEQESLKRRVALKVLTPHALVDARQIQRFQKEAETASRLVHDHIVPIHATGESEGIHFYSMQLIAGEGLDQVIARWRAEGAPSDQSRVVAELGRQAASALDHAHTSLILHRDIKPSNLLLDSDGKLWVTDFGIARALDEARVTRTGDFVGTLQYAAPEQLSGVSEARSDVYSLGLTLYESLALQPAFDSEAKGRLGGFEHHQGIKALWRVNPRIPKDLATIVSKSIEREVSHRYASASALADDLGRFLRGEAIHARNVSRFERLRILCRRNRLEAMAAMIALLVIIAAGVWGWMAYARAERALANQRAAEQIAQSNYVAQVAATSRAEASLGLAQDVLTEFYNAIIARDQALQMPGGGFTDVPVSPSISARELELLQNLLKYYDRSARLNAGEAGFSSDRARALSRVGDIHRWTGAFTESIAAYESALEILSALEARSPDEDLRMRRALIERHLSLAHSHLGQWAKSFRHISRSVGLLRRAENSERSMKTDFELARTLNVQGTLYASASEKANSQREYSTLLRKRRMTAPAVRSHREALEVARALKEEEPENPEVAFLIAANQRALAEVLLRSNKKPEAILLLVEATDLLDGLASDFDEVPDYRLEHALTLAILGSAQAPGTQGLVSCDKAIQLVRALVTEFPEVPRFQDSLAWVLHRSGDAKRRAELHQEALAEYAETCDLRDDLVQRFPHASHHRWGLVVARRSLGRLQWLMGDTEAAIETHQETVRRFDKEELRSHSPSRVPLAPVLRDLSDYLEKEGREWEADLARDRIRLWTPLFGGGRRF